MTERLGNRIQLVGDDLFVTNIKRLSCGIKLEAANAILVKVNQIGTLSEDAVEMAQKAGYKRRISHRERRCWAVAKENPAVEDRNAKYNQSVIQSWGELKIC